MELKDCLSLGLEARRNVITQWVAYIGLITFIITHIVFQEEPVALSPSLQLLGTAALILFEIVNVRGLLDGYKLMHAMTEEAKELAREAPLKSEGVRLALLDISASDRRMLTVVVHVLIGIGVLVVIWCPTLRAGTCHLPWTIR